MNSLAGNTIRRRHAQTGGQSDSNTGRKKLAGSDSRNRLSSLGSRPHPPAKTARVLRKLGKRIQALRSKKRLTQMQLANRCGMSALQLERIESGQVNLALSSIVRLAQKFHITVGQILRGIR